MLYMGVRVVFAVPVTMAIPIVDQCYKYALLLLCAWCWWVDYTRAIAVRANVYFFGGLMLHNKRCCCWHNAHARVRQEVVVSGDYYYNYNYERSVETESVT